MLATVTSKARAETATNAGNLMADLLSLGRGQVEVGPLGVFLVPADKVAPVIDQARKRAAELRSERAAAAATTPTP